MVDGMLGHKAASSQASAVVSMMGHWCQGTPEKQTFSAGVVSQGKKKLAAKKICNLS